MTTKTFQNYFSENGQVLLQFSFERGLIAELLEFEPIRMTRYGTARFKKHKQLFEYKHLLLLRDIW